MQWAMCGWSVLDQLDGGRTLRNELHCLRVGEVPDEYWRIIMQHLQCGALHHELQQRQRRHWSCNWSYALQQLSVRQVQLEWRLYL